jgi:hypothetical protein
MKKTDLEKNLALDLMRKMKQAGTADRFGQGAAQVPDRREQRRIDQAKGLVPFAVKLNGELVRELQALAAERKTDLNTLVEEVLRKGLAG